MLAQIGEFSFVLVAAGLAEGAIGSFAYKLTVLIIALSLLLSPAMIALARLLTRRRVGIAI
jgi:CPA2 family monovalent cation:H+ antiporter-2